MNDLVSRLRDLADCDARAGDPIGRYIGAKGECRREAADEIERLRALTNDADPRRVRPALHL